MPVYDYQCDNCGTTFEIERAIGFSGRVRCATCGSSRTSKVFAPAGVVFKGSGFYVTDSAGKSSSSVASSNGSVVNSDAPSPKPAKSKETKPAAED